MGWTSMHHSGNIHDFIAEEFSDSDYGEVVDHSKIGRVLYIAFRLGPRSGKLAGKITALIFLISTNKRKYHNFSYKAMDETVGPVEAKCPIRILNLLSPLEELYDPESWSYKHAKEWREKCRNREKYLSTRKIEIGDTIRLLEPLKFTNGMMADTFKKIKTNRWEAVGKNTIVRFALGEKPFEKVNTTTQLTIL